uniref:Angiopoietin-1 receptor n=1 Tax=Cacopsylla melanoneura TaxID=428564 RepID=A0A8D8MI69_9HEMI
MWWFKCTKLFLIIIYCISKCWGSYYDITTMYTFNTRRTEQGSTEYLNTCNLTVHTETNAVGLPYLNMDPTEPYKLIYPVPNSTIPPLTLSPLSAIDNYWTLANDKKWSEETRRIGVDNANDFSFIFRTRKGDMAKHFLNRAQRSAQKKNRITCNAPWKEIKWPGSFLLLKVKKHRKSNLVFKLNDKGGTIHVQVNMPSSNVDKPTVIFFKTNDRTKCEQFNKNANGSLEVYMSFKKGGITVYDANSQEECFVKYPSEYTWIDDYKKSKNVFELECKNEDPMQFELVEFIENSLTSSSTVQTQKRLVRKHTSLFILYHTNRTGTKEDLVKTAVTAFGDRGFPLNTEPILIILDQDKNDEYKYVLVKVTTVGWETSESIIFNIPSSEESNMRWVWEGGPSYQTVHELQTNIPCDKNTMQAYDVALKDPGRDPDEAEGRTLNCQNGGLEESWYCLCRPGFNGTNCENPCGPNAFGKNCTGRCSDDEARGCEGKLLCQNNDLGSAPCRCASGYQGPTCNETCTPGWYGSECELNCSPDCLYGCDGVTGNCHCNENCPKDRCNTSTGNCICNEACPLDRCNTTTGNCTCSETCSDSCDVTTGSCPELPTNAPDSDANDPDTGFNGPNLIIDPIVKGFITIAGFQIPGTVLGGTAALAILAWIVLNVYIFCFRKKKRKMEEEKMADEEEDWQEEEEGDDFFNAGGLFPLQDTSSFSSFGRYQIKTRKVADKSRNEFQAEREGAQQGGATRKDFFQLNKSHMQGGYQGTLDRQAIGKKGVFQTQLEDGMQEGYQGTLERQAVGKAVQGTSERQPGFFQTHQEDGTPSIWIVPSSAHSTPSQQKKTVSPI